MRLTLTSLVCVLALSACGGPSQTPQQRQQASANKAANAAAVKDAQTTAVNGKTFRVALRSDQGYSLVDLQGPATPYTVPEIEQASAAVTGCAGTFDGGVLALLGGDVRKADLGELRKKISSKFNGWRVNLKC